MTQDAQPAGTAGPRPGPPVFEGATLLGLYRVERRLDEGGMGAVYLARNESLGTPVIVKVPHVQYVGTPGFLERFRREIEGLVRLRHAHVVSILAQGQHEGMPYCVLEYLEGGSLARRLADQGVQSPDEVLAWLPAVAETLDYVHARGLIHRDVKPANILFDGSGGVFLSDFGISKVLGEVPTQPSLTSTGLGPGSPQYMAPEQGLGGALTPAADQYALAVTVYECLGGSAPFAGATPIQVLVRKGMEDPPDLGSLAPALAPGAARAVMKALRRDPRERHASCAAFAAAFAAGLPGGARAAAAGALAQTPPTVVVPGPAPGEAPARPDASAPAAGRRRAVALVALAAAAGLGVVLARGTGGGRPAAPPEPGQSPPVEARAPQPLPPPARPAPGPAPAPAPAPAPQATLRWMAPQEGEWIGRESALALVAAAGLPEGAGLTIAGQPAALVDGVYRAEVALRDLPEGPQVLEAAAPAQGLSARRTIRVDRSPPRLVVEAPSTAELETQAATAELRGQVLDAAPVRLTADGEDVAVAEGGAFTLRVALAPGASRSVTLQARDAAGNTADAGPYVLRRARPLHRVGLALESPAPGAVLGAREVEVVGSLEAEGVPAGLAVRVNGEAAVLVGARFRARVRAAADGELELVVTASGEGYAAAELRRKVVLDATPPVLTLLAPGKSPVVTPDAVVRFEGRVAEARLAALTIDGEPVVPDAEGRFHADVPARAQERTVEVRATDRAGNAAAPLSVRVRRDAPLVLTVAHPREGQRLPTRTNTWIPVVGRVEHLQPGDEVLVNGSGAEVAPDGSWLIGVEIEEKGAQTIEVSARRGGRVVARTRVPVVLLDEDHAPISPYRGVPAGQRGARLPWHHDPQAARAEARRTGRHLLTWFARSEYSVWDWYVDDHWFADPTVLAFLRERFVLLIIDSHPERAAGPTGSERFEHSLRLLVQGAPTIVLGTSSDVPYAHVESRQPDPAGFRALVEKLLDGGRAVERVLAGPASADEATLASALTVLEQQPGARTTELRALALEAQRRDAESAKGLRARGAQLAQQLAEAEQMRALLRAHDEGAWDEVVLQLQRHPHLRRMNYFSDFVFGAVRYLLEAGRRPEARLVLALLDGHESLRHASTRRTYEQARAAVGE